MTYKRSFSIALFPLILSVFITLFIIFSANFLPPKLPLFYSLSWGEKQLAENLQLLIIPASIALIALCNLIISWQLHDSQVFFKKILLFSSVLAGLILTITFLKIVLIFV